MTRATGPPRHGVGSSETLDVHRGVNCVITVTAPVCDDVGRARPCHVYGNRKAGSPGYLQGTQGGNLQSF